MAARYNEVSIPGNNGFKWLRDSPKTRFETRMKRRPGAEAPTAKRAVEDLWTSGTPKMGMISRPLRKEVLG